MLENGFSKCSNKSGNASVLCFPWVPPPSVVCGSRWGVLWLAVHTTSWGFPGLLSYVPFSLFLFCLRLVLDLSPSRLIPEFSPPPPHFPSHFLLIQVSERFSQLYLISLLLDFWFQQLHVYFVQALSYPVYSYLPCYSNSFRFFSCGCCLSLCGY